MTRLTPILGLTIIAVENKHENYDVETIGGLIPAETLAEVTWEKAGYKPPSASIKQPYRAGEADNILNCIRP